MTTEAKVGAFVLGCFSVLAFTLIYLINAQLGEHMVPYHTYLRYAGGLEPGASVLFGGIEVGKVKAVRPAVSDPTKIEILLDVKEQHSVERKIRGQAGVDQRDEPRRHYPSRPAATMRSVYLQGPRFRRRRPRAWTRSPTRWRSLPTTPTD